MPTSRRRSAVLQFALAKTIGSRLLTLLAIATVALAPSSAILQAAVFNWTGPGGDQNDPNSGNWNVASNWFGGLPPMNDPSTSLTFGGSSATPYTSTHNLGLMQVNGLTFSSSAPVTETINAAGGGSLRLVSNAGVDPTITQNGTSAFLVNVPMQIAKTRSVCWATRPSDPTAAAPGHRYSIH
jgi:hypothetical protein